MAEIIDFEEYKKNRAAILAEKHKITVSVKTDGEEKKVDVNPGCYLLFIYQNKELKEILISFTDNKDDKAADKNLTDTILPLNLYRYIMFCTGFDDLEMVAILLDYSSGECFEIDVTNQTEEEITNLPLKMFKEEYILARICEYMKWDYQELHDKLF